MGRLNLSPQRGSTEEFITEHYLDMASEYKTKPLTLETLEKYNKKVLLPDIKEVVNERMRHYTDKILKSNDKVIKELKPLREEQKAIDQNYKRLDKRVDTLEDFAEEAADVAGVNLKESIPDPIGRVTHLASITLAFLYSPKGIFHTLSIECALFPCIVRDFFLSKKGKV